MIDISRSIVFPSSDTKDSFNTSGGLESGVRWSVLDAVSVPLAGRSRLRL